MYFQHDESAGSATLLIVKIPNTDRQDAGPGITFPQVVDRSKGNRGPKTTKFEQIQVQGNSAKAEV